MATSTYQYDKYFSSATVASSNVDSSHSGMYNRFAVNDILFTYQYTE